MRCKPLFLLLLVAILHCKCSESTKSRSIKYDDFSFEDKEIKLEGSAFSDDTEDTVTDAKGEDDEDTLGLVSSGSGFEKDNGPSVHITKPPKPTKKPIFGKNPKAKKAPTATPGKRYPHSNDKDIEIPHIDNRIPEEPRKTDSTTRTYQPDNKEEEEPEMVDDNNTSNEIGLMGRKTDEIPPSFFAKPGILFAVIGGAVVGLLCAILLVMFIVYRMRKKDEGSYPLNEPRRSSNSNSYMRTSGKEFYA